MPFTVLMLCLVSVFLAYQLGFSGALYYDDFAPISRLARVEDLGSALYFAFSDHSGPLGRPIAMLSFLLHVDDWPENTAAIFRFNTLLHLANGILVASLTLILVRLMRGRTPRDGWLATGAAALWLVLPIQVSTSLIAIQRMAGLSAFFVFAGLVVYLKGLSIQAIHPFRGVLVQATGLGLFTMFAMFSKENGVLLPVFAWVLEVTLLARCDAVIRWRKTRLSIVSAALLVILGYLAYTTLRSDTSYLSRPFTLAERLMTEPQILSEYLRLAFLPRVFAFSPFHDDYTPISSLGASPVALESAIAWTVLLVAVPALRRRFPMPAFAVLWFLSGHLVESTVVGLELYYEHRNYVALFGPCLALAWLAGKLSLRYPRAAPTAFVTYVALQALVLIQVTSLWGDRLLAAEMWYAHNPTSSRAAANLAAIYNNEEKDTGAALRVMDRTLEACPQCIPLALQAVMAACIVEPQEKVASRLAAVKAVVNEGFVFSASAVAYLQGIHDLVKQGHCPAVSWETLMSINRALLQNRFVTASGRTEGVRVNIASILREQGKYSKAIHELQLAWNVKRDPGIAYPMVDLWLSLGMFREATNFADNEMCRDIPSNPILANASQERCKSFIRWVQNAETQGGR